LTRQAHAHTQKVLNLSQNLLFGCAKPAFAVKFSSTEPGKLAS